MIDVPTLQSSGLGLADALYILLAVALLAIAIGGILCITNMIRRSAPMHRKIMLACSYVLPVCVIVLVLYDVTNSSSMTTQRQDEVNKVNKTIESSLKKDYTITKVRSELDLDQARRAVKNDPTRAPKVTIVTAENEKRDVAVLLDPENGEVTLFSVNNDIDLKDLAKNTPTRSSKR